MATSPVSRMVVDRPVVTSDTPVRAWDASEPIGSVAGRSRRTSPRHDGAEASRSPTPLDGFP